MFIFQNNDFAILLVCEDDAIRKSISSKLEESYSAVYSVCGDKEAISTFRMYPIDIVIKYVKKYKEGDLELIADCRKLSTEIPTIAIYDFPKMPFFTRAVELGINRLFPYPLNEEMFMQALQYYCNSKVTNKMLIDQVKLLDEYKTAIDRSFLVSKADAHGIIIDANENFCKVSGYKRHELLGQNHNILRHPDSKDEMFKEMWKALQNKQTWRGRLKNIAKSGEEYVVESVISPIVDSDGRIKEYIAIRQDVTQFIKAGRLVIEQEKQRKEMEKEHYRMLNKTKDDFLVVFTHELKTPLNAIINFSNSAAKRIEKIDTPKKDSLIEMMEIIKNNGNDMLQTINNILDLSRIKSNRLEYKKDRFMLKDVFSDLLCRFDSLLEEAEVKIAINWNHMEEEMVMDKFRTSQIISNLLSNAIKYSNKEVSIYADIDNNIVRLTIEDNGPGIANKEKIFDLYEQEDDDGIKRASKGTGIGLHFVKLLCDDMHIGLELTDSEALGGAKFALEFTLDTYVKKTRITDEEYIDN